MFLRLIYKKLRTLMYRQIIQQNAEKSKKNEGQTETIVFQRLLDNLDFVKAPVGDSDDKIHTFSLASDGEKNAAASKR